MRKLIILLALPHFLLAQKPQEFNLFDLKIQDKLQTINREIAAIDEGSFQFMQLAESKGEGLVWLPTKGFKNGEIEIEMRGKDLLQRSFIGLAFHGQNDSTYEAVYCRPFNFFARDSVRRIHAIQYISHPDFTWKKLRETRNAVFEKRLVNPPYPNGWFTMRLVIDEKTVKAYINQEKTPALTVDRLTDRKDGKVGIFVGDGGGGDFKSIKITEDKKVKTVKK
jgi:hypothetical protein